MFGLDHDDAVLMSKRSGGTLQPSDFAGLPAFEAYVDLVSGNQASGYASARTVPLTAAQRSLSSVLSTNRRRVGVDRRETERRLSELVEGSGGGSDVNGRSTTAAGGPSADAFGDFGTIPGNDDGVGREPPVEARLSQEFLALGALLPPALCFLLHAPPGRSRRSSRPCAEPGVASHWGDCVLAPRTAVDCLPFLG